MSPSIGIKPGSFTINGQGGASCTPSSVPFNGTFATALLSGDDDLAGGQSCVIAFTVTLDYASSTIPATSLENTAYASGSYTNGVPNPGYTFAGGVPTPPVGASSTDASSAGASPPNGSPEGTPPITPTLPSVAGGDSPSPATIILPPQSDMQANTTLPSSVSAGQSITVSGTCTNAGPSSAAAATCSLSGLPLGATQSCTPTPPVTSLVSGASIVCTSTFTAPASGVLNITTTAATSTTDPVASNNTNTKVATIVAQADMQATASGFPTAPAAGTTATGTMTCTNNGPSDAPNASCSVSSLPVGATVNCTPTSPVTTLAVGASIVCSVSYVVPSSGGVTITGVSSSAAADPNVTNNSAQASANVVPQADMQALTTVPTSANAGQSVTVSGVCTNAGPSVATLATCSLSGLPAGATQNCTPSPVPSPLTVNRTITCTSTFIAPASGPLNISTTAGSITDDPVNGNNTDTKPLPVVAQSDMSAVFSGFPANPAAGSQVVGTLTCTNNGPSTAVNATCLPAGLPPGASVSCAPASPVSSLALGASIVCSINFTTPSSGAINLTGTAGSANADPIPANNATSVSSAVVDQADMQATISGLTASPLAGSTTTGTAVCTNAGPSSAASATCTITGLPPGATQTCSPTPSPLVLGASITCNFSFTTPATGALTIRAIAASITADPNLGNNTSTQAIAVAPLADMQAVLTGFPSNATAGSTVSGQLICTNNGPSPAQTPTCVPNALPPGATVSCMPTPIPSNLAMGASITCSISFVMPANSQLTLSGTAGSVTPDPNTTNNSASTQSNTIRAAADQSTASLSGASGGVGITNVLANDTINGTSVTVAQVTLTQTSTTHPNVQLNAANGEIRVAPGTPNGTYSVNYQICTRTAPIACDSAIATIIVGSAIIDAVNDPQIMSGPRGSTTNLLANDTLDGSAVNASDVTPSLVDSGGLNGLSLDAAGNLIVPPGTSPGSYTVRYQICEKINPRNCDSANVTIVVQGAISGSVWFDVGDLSGSGATNRQRDAGELGLANWTVEVLFASGTPSAGQIATTVTGQPAIAITDSAGNYQIPGMPPGEYQLRFRTPASSGQANAYGTPVNGEQGNPQVGSAIDSASRTLKLTVGFGTRLSQQSLPVDPSGVVYDSITRQPIQGATVVLLGPDGVPVSANLLMPGQQGQTVISSGPAAGTYRFDLLPGAPIGTYTIVVTPPANYLASTLIAPQSNVLTPPNGCVAGTNPSICAVQVQNGPPLAGQPAEYYLRMAIDVGQGIDILRNHIPLDPINRPSLLVTKSGDRSLAEIGDTVRYVIRIRNYGTAPATGVQLIDSLPAGFGYLLGTSSYTGTSAVAASSLANPAGGRGPQLVFGLPGRIEVGEEALLSYRVRLGVGSIEGDGINRALARVGALISNEARFTVKVTAGVFSTSACIAGKVYVDCNGNRVQDSEELGIPGVRLFLQNGTYLISDSEGKYSFCGLPPTTFVLKVDQTTLPNESKLVTSSNRNLGDANSLMLDLKNGELHRADFIEGSCSISVINQIKARRQQGEVRKSTNENAERKNGTR